MPHILALCRAFVSLKRASPTTPANASSQNSPNTTELVVSENDLRTNSRERPRSSSTEAPNDSG